MLNKKNFAEVLTALLDNDRPFPPRFLERFSDLDPDESLKLKQIWTNIRLQRRVDLMDDLEKLSEVETLVQFEEVAKIGLEDSDPRVRVVAVRLLWEVDDDKYLIPRFLRIMKEDPSEEVRAAAASALGKYIYLGELEEIPQAAFRMLEDELLQVISSTEKPSVRQKALEAISFSAREEAIELIRTAYESGDHNWLISALFAMGRSGDDRWEEIVLSHLQDEDSELRFEAVRAAGELCLAAARRPLLEMLTEEGLEEDTRFAAIWSLSEIGGRGVREVLEALRDSSEDEETTDFLEEAFVNLELTEGLEQLEFLHIDPLDQSDLDHIIDLEQDDNPSAGDSGLPKKRKSHKKSS